MFVFVDTIAMKISHEARMHNVDQCTELHLCANFHVFIAACSIGRLCRSTKDPFVAFSATSAGRRTLAALTEISRGILKAR